MTKVVIATKPQVDAVSAMFTDLASRTTMLELSVTTPVQNLFDTVNTTLAQKASVSYVDGKISALIGGAPAAALDTIAELAAALQADQSAVGSITASLASKADAAAMTTALAGKASLTVTDNLATRVAAWETWKNSPAAASPDVSTIVSVPTAVITLGLNCPTVAGINALGSAIMSEVNGLKSILRSKGILAT